MSGFASQTSSVKVEISAVFTSPSGYHTIVTCATGDVYYVSLDAGAATLRLRNHVVTAVFWQDDQVDGSAELILGTQVGKILSCTIDGKKDILATARVVGDIPNERIVDIAMWQKSSCFVSTKSMVFHFSGSGPSNIFLNSPLLVWESPVACMHSKLVVGADMTLTWLNGVSVISTKLPLQGSSSNPSLSVVYPHADKSLNPRGIAVRDHHYIVQYDSKLCLVSRIALGQPVATIPVAQHGSFAALVYESRGMVFVNSDKRLFQIVVGNESGDVWKHWLRKRNYAQALAATVVKTERAFVLKHEADFILDSVASGAVGGVAGREGLPVAGKEAAEGGLAASCRAAGRKAATLYASAMAEDSHVIESAFDEIVAKLERIDKASLLEFLLARIDAVNSDESREVVQISVLFVYCAHLFIDLLLEDPSGEVREDFFHFVAEKHSSLNPQCIAAVYELLESVGLFTELARIASLTGDMETAVRVDLQLGDYEGVLRRFEATGGGELYSQLSPLLFRFCPRELVSFAIRHNSDVSAVAAAGALTRDHKDQAVLLLNHWLVRGDKSKASLNLLFQLTCELDPESVPQLIDSIHKRSDFDSNFCLRTVRQFQLSKAEIVLLSVSGLHLVATQKALAAKELGLAKSCAWRSARAETRRLCWLEIVRSEAEPAMDLFLESEVLELTDVLPLLPEGDVGVQAKIAEQIRAVQARSDEAKREIENFQDALKLIRNDMIKKPNECILLSYSQKCDLCFSLLFGDKFFAFPCGHCFHDRCLRDALCKRTAANGDDSVITKNCCLCGHDSLLLDQLFDPLVDPAVDGSAIQAWAIA